MNSRIKPAQKCNSAAIAMVLALCAGASAAELKQKTADAFNKYVAVTEERMAGELKPGGAVLYPHHPGPNPSEEKPDAYAPPQRGEILVEGSGNKAGGRELRVS